MTNLLPEIERRRIWSGLRARFVLAGSTLAITAAVLSALSLVPSYVVYEFATGASGTESPSLPAALSGPETFDLSRAQMLSKAFLPFVSATTTPTDIIKDVLALLPRGVKVDHITYTPGSPSSLMLAGLAVSREGINAYRDALSASLKFKTVSVPVGALVGTDAGRFTVTLSGNF
ncbi:hypothetical protein HY968_02530 [Candidatus Kaiserbacteria bacterium]|nr:hypothetical protein [Candidatus Kaiserbacteria bacterium]